MTPMNANVAADRELARRLLAEYGLSYGDRIVIENRARRETRTYTGRILFAFVTNNGDIRITYSGASRWAPGSATCSLLREPEFGNRYLRRASGAETTFGFGHREVA